MRVNQKALGNLRLRVLAAIAGIVVIVGTLFLGSVPFAVVMAAIAGLALNEFYALFREQHHLPNEVLGVAAGAAFPLSAVAFGEAGLVATLFLAVLAVLIWYLAFGKTNLTDMAVTVFGAAYVGFLLSFLVLMRALTNGVSLVVLVLVATWVNDTAAYFAGVVFGKSKLAPRISPGKTWEGTITGIGVTVVVLGALTFVNYLDAVERVILGLVVAVSAVAGDLAESRVKRELGVKDAGKLIPGHGGFLDRFDSLLFVSGSAYFLLTALFKVR